ncbi:MAG: lipopolysaccharide biosynthesis protein [Thermomicrobiales bacterium]
MSAPVAFPPPTGNDTSRTALGTHATRAAFWNTVLLPAKLGSHLLAQLVLANALPKAEFGVYVLALSVGVTSGSLVDLGTERSVVKFLPEVAGRQGRRGVRTLLSWVFGFKLAVLVPVLALATLFHQSFFRYLDRRIPPIPADKVNDQAFIQEHDRIASLVSSQHWTIFFAVVSLVLVGAFYDVAMQSLVATFKNKSWNVITIFVTLLDPIVVTIIVLGSGNIGIVLVGRVGVALIAMCVAGIYSIYAVRESVAEERQYVSAEQHERPLPIRRFALYSSLQYALQVTSFFTSYAFAALILTNAEEIAGYRVASGSVREILAALTTPIIGIQVPIFTRIFTARDDRQLNVAYGLVARFLALVLIPGAVGLSLLIPNLFRILYPKYESFTSVCIVLIVLLFAESCLSTGTTVLLTFERYGAVIAARAIALIALPVMFFTARTYGAMGAALTSGGFAVLAALVGTIASNAVLPIRYPLDFVRRVGIAALSMGAVVGGLAFTVARVPANAGGGLHRIFWLAVTGGIAAIGGAVYLAVFRRIGGVEPTDIDRLRTLRIPMRGLIVRLLTGERA